MEIFLPSAYQHVDTSFLKTGNIIYYLLSNFFYFCLIFTLCILCLLNLIKLFIYFISIWNTLVGNFESNG